MSSMIGIKNLLRRHDKLERVVRWLELNMVAQEAVVACLDSLVSNARVFIHHVPDDGGYENKEWCALRRTWQRGFAVVSHCPTWDQLARDSRQNFLLDFVTDHPEFVDWALFSEMQQRLTSKRRQIAQAVIEKMQRTVAMLDTPVFARPQPVVELRSDLMSAITEARRWGVPCIEAIDTQKRLDQKLLAWATHFNTYTEAHLNEISLAKARSLLDDCYSVERLVNHTSKTPITQSVMAQLTPLISNIKALEHKGVLLTSLVSKAETLSVLYEPTIQTFSHNQWQAVAQAGSDYVATVTNLGSISLDDLSRFGYHQSNYADHVVAAIERLPVPGIAAQEIVAWLCEHDPTDNFTKYAHGISLDHRPVVWESAFLAHFRARCYDSLKHGQLHGLALNAAPHFESSQSYSNTMAAGQLLNTSWVHAIPTDRSLSSRQREELLMFVHATTEQIKNASSRPPDGWKALIVDEPFRSWGWRTIRVHPTPFAWGRVLVTGPDTKIELTVSPDTKPDLTRDGVLLTYVWILSWVDSVSRQEALIPAVATMKFRHPSSKTRSRVVHRVLGGSARQVVRSRNRVSFGIKRHVLAHPVASYRRFVSPGFVANQNRIQLAREALMELPIGYTFVPHHWSPRQFDPKTVTWVRVRWNSHSAMPEWRRILHGVGSAASPNH